MMDETGHDEDPEEKEDSGQCEHVSAGSRWLPILKKKKKDLLAPHPHCACCGLVRNIGPDRAKKKGYYVEALSELKRSLEHEHNRGGRHKLTEAQTRLITKEMEEDELFSDTYGNLFSAQAERFVEIVKKIRPDLKDREIEFYIE